MSISESRQLRARRRTLQFAFAIAVWLALSALCTWKATGGSLFFAFFAVFCLYRLVSEVSVYRIDSPGPGNDRRETVAVWLVVGRTAVTGAVVLAGSVVAMIVRPHAAVIILGVCGILVGQALLIFGIQLLAQLRRGSSS